MTDPTDTSLKAAVERAYDEIQQRKGKPRRDPPKPLRHELSRLQDTERFIALCKREWEEEGRWKRDAAEAEARGDAAKRAPRSTVKAWIEEYRTPDPADCTSAHFSFPLIYVSYVAALAQAQPEGEIDLREETARRILDAGLRDLIDRIVKRRCDITFADFKAALVDSACPGTTIEEVDNGIVQWLDDNGEGHPISDDALKRRLSRAKKEQRERGL